MDHETSNYPGDAVDLDSIETLRCDPCELGNHTGTNGTSGCEGDECTCSCREVAR